MEPPKLVPLFDRPELPAMMVPEWVANLVDQFGKGLEKKLSINPETGDPAMTFGKITGLIEGIISNPAPAISPDAQQKLHPLSKNLLETYQQMLQQLPAAISEIQSEAVKESYEEKNKFFEGYTSIRESAVTDPQGIPEWSTPAMPIYGLMLAYWKAIDQMPSVTALHEFICKAFPGQQIERKRIEGICSLIGLRFREPGRPRKTENS